MNASFSAFSIQLLGPRYKRIWSGVFACMILYVSLFAAEIRIAVAPSVLFLTVTVFTAGAIRQALGSDRCADTLRGALMLPFQNGSFVFAYVGALGFYTLITKSALVLAVLLAIGEWNAQQILLALLLAGNACVVTAVGYPLSRRRRFLMMLLWAPIAIALLFFSHHMAAMLSTVGFGTILSLCCLLRTDAYEFYRSPTKLVVKHSAENGSLATYFIRYLIAHKNYLINTVGSWAVACFLPFMLGQVEGLNMLPTGLAILTLNTPVCVLLSCDPDFERGVRLLPGQEARFGIRYCMFIFVFNLVADAIYLCSWQIVNSDVDAGTALTALAFAFHSAFLSVLLEWKWPLHNWKTESDLFHRPRKYCVPLVMIVLAVLVSAFPALRWMLLTALIVICIGLYGIICKNA